MSKQQEDGVHRLAKPINEKYKSDDERRKDPARVLAGITSQSSSADSRQRWKYGRELASPSRLVAWADEHGLVLDPTTDLFGRLQVLGSGGEHIVFDATLDGRLIKLTKPGLFGAQAEDAGAYFQRHALANRVLGDDVRFEGIVTLPGEDSPRAIISQPFVEGRDATTEEQHDYLRSKGFVEHEGKFVHPTLGVTVWDTITSGNVIAKPDGTFQAIDLQVEPSTAEDLNAVREQSGIGLPTMFSKSASPESEQREATPADIGRHWMKIAEDPETAILGETPTEKDFRPILEKLAGPDAQNVEIQEEKLPSGEPSGIVNFREGPRNNIVLDMSNPDEIYINSQYAGEMGTPIYQAIYAWAHNNGKQIVGDPAGLSGMVKGVDCQLLTESQAFGVVTASK